MNCGKIKPLVRILDIFCRRFDAFMSVINDNFTRSLRFPIPHLSHLFFYAYICSCQDLMVYLSGEELIPCILNSLHLRN